MTKPTLHEPWRELSGSSPIPHKPFGELSDAEKGEGGVSLFESLRGLISYDPATGKFTRLVDVAKYKAGSTVGCDNGNGYLTTTHKGKKIYLHRLAWYFHTGSTPEYQIDHINGVRDDNRIENLRSAGYGENQQSRFRRRDNTSGVTGVNFVRARGKWAARLTHGGKVVFGKYDFETKEEAEAAYRKAKYEHHSFQRVLTKRHYRQSTYPPDHSPVTRDVIRPGCAGKP